ncbi:hypothetical protein [Maribacter aestuarii]|uniref:hypothetical protein n=1 Tax=Maribacter aestuarii TaxID=1130723 RepID=UPI0025A5ECA6|nr:hypothetical protein [Maribacter aestuarii]
MEKLGKDDSWKATDSSPVDTKQKDGVGVRNQTTKASEGKFPLATIIIIVLLLIIVGFFLFLGVGSN